MEVRDLAVLERRLSPERLTPYRAAGHGDLGAAVRLYEWNVAVSAALGETFGQVEVLLRNAMHDQLTSWSRRVFAEPRWYLDPGGFLFPEAVDDIAKARIRATRTGRPESAGRVVAELNLGFWRFLLARRYDRVLWHPCLNRAFPRQRRAVVADAIGHLHEARNRIAHHEPMFNRPLTDLFDTALQVASWICPVGHRWVREQSRVPALLVTRPS
ncbi:hypothetical protein [Dactylosporangium sp. CA-092794]|uniref:hypothetical protein n=1 Tax=Dactylosporangium sp. CA-092794 TaxID=3239929 RepID=UPI003D8E7BBA